MQTLNIQNLSEKIGVTDTTIKSGKNKDLLNPFHPVDPEHRALLQTSIDAMHARFVELVAAGRHLKKNKVSELADGRIFTADQALQHGLIDHIGYWEDAVSHTAKLLAVENIFVVSYADKKGFLGNLLGANNPRLPDITSLVSSATTPRRLYLWRP
jgi:protease-4